MGVGEQLRGALEAVAPALREPARARINRRPLGVVMRVCMFGTYEAGYDREQVLPRSVRKAGIEVVECHAPSRTFMSAAAAAARALLVARTFEATRARSRKE